MRNLSAAIHWEAKWPPRMFRLNRCCVRTQRSMCEPSNYISMLSQYSGLHQKLFSCVRCSHQEERHTITVLLNSTDAAFNVNSLVRYKNITPCFQKKEKTPSEFHQKYILKTAALRQKNVTEGCVRHGCSDPSATQGAA